MPKKKITPSEYAKLRGISLSGVTEAIRKQWSMPGVSSVEKFGRFYLLTVSLNKDGGIEM